MCVCVCVCVCVSVCVCVCVCSGGGGGFSSKIHIMFKLIILTILSVQFSCVKYIHLVMQP